MGFTARSVFVPSCIRCNQGTAQPVNCRFCLNRSSIAFIRGSLSAIRRFQRDRTISSPRLATWRRALVDGLSGSRRHLVSTPSAHSCAAWLGITPIGLHRVHPVQCGLFTISASIHLQPIIRCHAENSRCRPRDAVQPLPSIWICRDRVHAVAQFTVPLQRANCGCKICWRYHHAQRMWRGVDLRTALAQPRRHRVQQLNQRNRRIVIRRSRCRIIVIRAHLPIDCPINRRAFDPGRNAWHPHRRPRVAKHPVLSHAPTHQLQHRIRLPDVTIPTICRLHPAPHQHARTWIISPEHREGRPVHRITSPFTQLNRRDHAIQKISDIQPLRVWLIHKQIAVSHARWILRRAATPPYKSASRTHHAAACTIYSHQQSIMSMALTSPTWRLMMYSGPSPSTVQKTKTIFVAFCTGGLSLPSYHTPVPAI